jgi:hypothetical protein
MEEQSEKETGVVRFGWLAWIEGLRERRRAWRTCELTCI